MERDLFSFLDWDWGDEEGGPDAALVAYKLALEQRSGGDDRAALTSLDRGLQAAGLDDRGDGALAALLAQKAVILGEIGRQDEALAIFHRVVEVSGDGSEAVQFLGVLCRVQIARILDERGEHEDALFQLRDVESAYGRTRDTKIRAAAVFAQGCRLGVLLDLGRIDEARAEWLNLRESHGGDPEPQVRAEVAAAGRSMATTFLDKKQLGMTVTTADQAMALYRSETDPQIRAAVAVTMWAISMFALLASGCRLGHG